MERRRSRPGSTVRLAGGGITVGQTELELGALRVGVGGTLRGGGTITGSVDNLSGSGMPGTSPGMLTINGAFEQNAGGVIEVEIGGSEAGVSYDRLCVAGTTALGGRLRLNQLAGFVPAQTDTFVILTAGQVTGRFSNAPCLATPR